MPLVPAILQNITAGAPRLAARLYAIDKFLTEIPPPESILEIGPGLGDLSAHLVERFPSARLVLSEISSEAARILEERFKNQARISISQADILFGDRGTEQFDLVIACEVFEHIEDDCTGLRSVAALLRDGGHFIFSAPCHMRKWQSADVFAGHFRRYEREELVQKLERSGMEIKHLWTFGFPTVNLLQPFREIYYRSRNRAHATDKQTATKKSGIDRPEWMRRARGPVIATMLPLLPIERLFWRKELGDGFLALARKR
ncbi:MAG: methyltransferase domain-containing protein [Chthoniobacterales bacterium]